MQVLSKSKAKAGSGIQQQGKSSFLRNEWRSAYRNARLVATLERDFSLGLSSLRNVFTDMMRDAHSAQLGNKCDSLKWPIGHILRDVSGPKGKLPR